MKSNQCSPCSSMQNSFIILRLPNTNGFENDSVAFFSSSFIRSAKRYIIPIVAFSLLYNFPKFFELTTGERTWLEGNNITVYCIEGTEMRNNATYYEVRTRDDGR